MYLFRVCRKVIIGLEIWGYKGLNIEKGYYKAGHKWPKNSWTFSKDCKFL